MSCPSGRISMRRRASLLQENQLLYAVLQVDKREETPRLSCRWLDDLTRADEAMIEACDRAFDSAKSQTSQRAKRPPATPKKEPMTIKKLNIKIDARQGRHSQVLKLKTLFEQHRGDSPIQIDFLEEETPIGSIQIDSRWGVKPSPQLFQELEKFPGVLEVKSL